MIFFTIFLLLIIVISLLSKNLFKNVIEPFQTSKGTLYLFLEAPILMFQNYKYQKN